MCMHLRITCALLLALPHATLKQESRTLCFKQCQGNRGGLPRAMLLLLLLLGYSCKIQWYYHGLIAGGVHRHRGNLQGREDPRHCHAL